MKHCPWLMLPRLTAAKIVSSLYLPMTLCWLSFGCDDEIRDPQAPTEEPSVIGTGSQPSGTAGSGGSGGAPPSAVLDAFDQAERADAGSNCQASNISSVYSTIDVSSPVVASGKTLTVALTLADENKNVLDDCEVHVEFSLLDGDSTGRFSQPIKEKDGVYRSEFLAISPGSPTAIGATVNGVTITSTLPTVTVILWNVSLNQSIVSVDSSLVTVNSKTKFNLQIRDAIGNPISDGSETVVFELITGDAQGSIGETIYLGNGVYSATFTASSVGSATTVQAKINGHFVTSLLPTIEVISPSDISVSDLLSQSTIEIDSPVISSGSTTNVRLIARRSNSDRIAISGLAVIFSRRGGTSTATLGQTTDHGDGSYSAILTGAGTGTAASLVATIAGVEVTSLSPTFTVTPGAISNSTSLVSVSSSTVASGSSVTITVAVKDVAGNQLNRGGSNIQFCRTGGTSTGIFSAVNDNLDGTYATTFTGLDAGTSTTICATIDEVPVTSTLPTITVIPGAVSAAQSVIFVATPTVVIGGTVTLTLQTRDANGNLLSSGGAAVVFSLLNGSSNGTLGPTTDINNGTYTATFTGTIAGTATSIGAIINGVPVTSTLPTITVYSP